MSPEQASGEATSARSDLYSLGATLYQLATGTLPYSGSPAKVMSMIAAGSLVPPVRRRPSCGADVSRLIERAMAVDVNARPPSAIALAAELRALANAGGLGDPTEELAAYFEDPGGFLRTRTPTVVGALVAAGRSAVAEARLPRAMALADRASALAPDDPGVTALVQTVTQGGRASRRNHAIALVALVVALAGGGTLLGMRLVGSSTANSEPDAPRASEPEPPAAAAPSDAQAAMVSTLDASDDLATDARRAQSAAAVPPRAPATHEPARRQRAAVAPPATLPPPVDVAAPPIDAAVAVEPPAPPAIDAAPAIGHIVVQNPVWCDIWIDGALRGNLRDRPIEVPVGKHIVRCVNPAGEWTRETDVAPGSTRTLVGTVPDIAVTLEIDATIDGTRYARGSVVRLKPRRLEVIADGKRQFITFRVSCTLKDTPELECYR
jgi:serine/threonine-protein kinase